MILDPSAPCTILSIYTFRCRKLAVFHHSPSGVMLGLGGIEMYVHVKLVIVEQACINYEVPENVY